MTDCPTCPSSLADASLTARHCESIIDSSDDAIITKTLAGIVVSWNRSAERIFGYTAAEIIGRPMVTLFPADRLGEEPQILARIAAGEKVEHFETVRVRKDGQLLHVSATISPIFDAAGQVVGASKIARDITDRVRAESAYRARMEEAVAERTADLLRARDDAEAANRAKSAFLAAISHELRTPLTSIRGCSELIERRAQEEAVRNQAGLIRKGAEDLNTLLSEILDFAKMEGGAMSLSPAPVELAPLVEEAAGLYTLTASEKGLTVTTVVDAACPRVLTCDRLRLKQVLHNLLSNAVKFTSTGGIHLHAHRQGPMLTIDVDDTGTGIAPDMQELVFEKFRQADARISHDHGGTGLGLALARGLARLMGGDLVAQSTVGVGSRFSLTLPVEAPAQVHTNQPCA